MPTSTTASTSPTTTDHIGTLQIRRLRDGLGGVRPGQVFRPGLPAEGRGRQAVGLAERPAERGRVPEAPPGADDVHGHLLVQRVRQVLACPRHAPVPRQTPAGPKEASAFAVLILWGSRSHRFRPGRISVLVDDPVEDAGTQEPAGHAIVQNRWLFPGFGWSLVS